MFQLTMILLSEHFSGPVEYSEAEISAGLEVEIMLLSSQVVLIFTVSGWKSCFDDFLVHATFKMVSRSPNRTVTPCFCFRNLFMWYWRVVSEHTRNECHSFFSSGLDKRARRVFFPHWFCIFVRLVFKVERISDVNQPKFFNRKSFVVDMFQLTMILLSEHFFGPGRIFWGRNFCRSRSQNHAAFESSRVNLYIQWLKITFWWFFGACEIQNGV